VAENSRLRAWRYELPPGVSTPQHTHVRPCLLVAVTAGELHTTPAGGSPVVRGIAAGSMEWFGEAATHTLTNAAAEPAVLVEIELR
jgi:uncharacterized cupin superfamily protein